MSELIPDDEQARARLEAQALEFARNYLVFVRDPRAKALLEHWTKTLARRRISVNAPHTEYAAVCAIRDFVEDIKRQIEIAETGKLD
jgi:hypothetical protein